MLSELVLRLMSLIAPLCCFVILKDAALKKSASANKCPPATVRWRLAKSLENP